MNRALCMMLAGAVALLSRPALADEASEREARALFAAGHRQVSSGDYRGALERFEKAYALMPSPKILLNIGTMLRQLGREAEAANIYAQYLADPGADPKRRAEVGSLIQDLDARLARLDIDIRETGGRVLLDGQPVGQPGKRVALRVAPGTHAVSIERPGASPVPQSLVLAAGDTQEIVVAPEASAAPVQTADAAEKPPNVPAAHAAPQVAKGGSALAGKAPVGDAPAPEETAGDVEGRSHAGQLGGVVRADVDGMLRGVSAMVGLSHGLGDRVEIGLGALLSPARVGVEPNAVVYFTKGAFKPLASVGLPVFLQGEPYPGFRGSAGLQWDPSPAFGLFAQVGASVFPRVPEGYDHVVFLPSLGVQSRL